MHVPCWLLRRAISSQHNNNIGLESAVSGPHSDINKPLKIKSNPDQIKIKSKSNQKLTSSNSLPKLILSAWPTKHHQLLTRPRFLQSERRAADRTPSKSTSNRDLSHKSSRTDTFFSIQTLLREHITPIISFEACMGRADYWDHSGRFSPQRLTSSGS